MSAHRDHRVLDVRLSKTERHQPLSTTPVDVGYRSGNRPWQQVQPDQKLYTTNELFNRLQEATVEGRCLPDWMIWEDVSLWQFLPSYLWPTFARAVGLAGTVNQLVTENPATLLRYQSVNDHTEHIWQDVARSVAESHGIRSECIGSPAKSNEGKPRAHFWGRIAPVAAAHQALKLGLPGPSTDIGDRLLFSTVARNWRADGDGGMQDEQCEPILAALRRRGWSAFVGVDCPYHPRSEGLNSLRKRRRSAPDDTRWVGFYANTSIRRIHSVYREARVHFDSVWRRLRESDELAAHLSHDGVSLLPPLRDELSRAFVTTLPHCAAMLVAARDLLDAVNPSALVATYETGPYQRALIVEAIRRSIPTVGLMHGLITDSHYDYNHRNVDASADHRVATFTVPDVTCVWGKAAERCLTETGHYPLETVARTGNWRHDHLRNVDRMPPVGLDRPRRVLIVSGGQQVAHFVETCLDSLPANSDPTVRLHPVDDPDPVIKMLEATGRPGIIDEGRIMTEALNQTDVVVSQWSTTITEAILVGKPTVFTDFYALGHQEYLEFDAFLHATTPDQMRSHVEAALGDAEVRSRLWNNRNRFVEELFGYTDGGSADRVASIVADLVSSKADDPEHNTIISDTPERVSVLTRTRGGAP